MAPQHAAAQTYVCNNNRTCVLQKGYPKRRSVSDIASPPRLDTPRTSNDAPRETCTWRRGMFLVRRPHSVRLGVRHSGAGSGSRRGCRRAVPTAVRRCAPQHGPVRLRPSGAARSVPVTPDSAPVRSPAAILRRTVRRCVVRSRDLCGLQVCCARGVCCSKSASTANAPDFVPPRCARLPGTASFLRPSSEPRTTGRTAPTLGRMQTGGGGRAHGPGGCRACHG